MFWWVVIGIIVYLSIGYAFIYLLMWIDSLTESEIPWISEEPDSEEIAMTILLWPLFVILGIFELIFELLPNLFYRGMNNLIKRLINAAKGQNDDE